jgi:hypothetical protein
LIAIAWVIFISVILSIPDDMRAGKTLLGLTLLLVVWYLAHERRRFRGPAWALSHAEGPSTAASDRVISGGQL